MTSWAHVPALLPARWWSYLISSLQLQDCGGWDHGWERPLGRWASSLIPEPAPNLGTEMNTEDGSGRVV